MPSCATCNTTFKYSDAKLLEQNPITKKLKAKGPCYKGIFFVDLKKEAWLCEV